MHRPDHIRIARKRTHLGAPTAAPIRAVIVTIDAAKCSGVATYIAGRLHHYCEVPVQDGPARRRVLRDAVTMAEVRGMPVACILEVPWGGRVSAALSLTATVALWRDAWRAMGRRDEHLLEFTANDWRRALFGSAGMPRAQARRLEAEIAARTAERDMPATRHYKISGDAAAAICIGQVVIRSGTVAAALGLSSNTGKRHTV